MITIKTIYIFIFFTLFYGCSGSSGEQSSDNTHATPEATAEEPVEETNNALTSDYTASEDVVANPNFGFDSVSVVRINITIDALKYRRAYINICHKNNDDELQYDNCLLNTPLKNGELHSDLTVANGVGSLGMEIWVYSVDEIPLKFIWSRDDGMTWLVEA